LGDSKPPIMQWMSRTMILTYIFPATPLCFGIQCRVAPAYKAIPQWLRQPPNVILIVFAGLLLFGTFGFFNRVFDFVLSLVGLVRNK
jgi:hypothetical protein